MGVKFVNPSAKVYIEWSNVKDNDIQSKFKSEGITYISDQDMITPHCSSRRFGLYNVEDENNRQNIAMPVWHWGVFYEKLIQSILAGSWKHEEDMEGVKALNYWWGMSAEVVDLICSGKLPTEILRLVELFKKVICKGEFELFSGRLVDQNGIVRNDNGSCLMPEDIITMDWLLDNVVGSIPEFDELEESAKALVIAQGVVQE